MSNTSNRRFSLLLLDDKEYLFQSVAAKLYNYQTSSSTSRTASGRLFLCSRCIFFEPKELTIPLIKFPFSEMINEPSAYQPSESDLQSADANISKTSSFSFMYKSVVHCKENGNDTPYNVIKYDSPKQSIVILQHTNLDNFLPLVWQLWQVSNDSDKTNAAMQMNLIKPIIEPRLYRAFDKSRLVDFREVLLTDDSETLLVDRIERLINVPGCLVITNKRIYFQPADLNNISEACMNIDLSKIVHIYEHRYLLRSSGLNICYSTASTVHSVLFNFRVTERRNYVYNIINNLLNSPTFTTSAFNSPYNSPYNSPSTNVLLDKQLLLRSSSEANNLVAELKETTRKWQSKELDNFSYLMYLNTMSHRTVHDLTQYPVFPWVIADYTSSRLDLTKESTFRDLSKPMGALNPERLEGFLERYHHMVEAKIEHPPPFLYGTHYSTPGYVLFYLVRQFPDLMLKLQNGKFDDPDRLFNSIESTYHCCLNNSADLKELIPEFYHIDSSMVADPGEFLINSRSLDLGRKQNGELIGDVELPPWADSSYDFIRKCREALECDHVSNHLHLWIDLVFGFKQRGEAAVEANNLFYYLTYEGAEDLDLITDPIKREALEIQIYEFGQTPKQLFTSPHPPRFPAGAPAAATVAAATTAESQLQPRDAEEQHSGPPPSYHQVVDKLSSQPPRVPPLDVAASSIASTPNASRDEATVSGNRSFGPSGSISSGGIDDWTANKLFASASTTTAPQPVASFEAVASNSSSGSNKQQAQQPVAKPAVKKNSVSLPPAIVDSDAAAAGVMIKAHRMAVNAICLSGDKELLFSVSHDSSLSFYSLLQQRITRRINVGKLSLSSCCVLSGGNSIVIGSWDNHLHLYSVDFGTVIERIPVHDDAVSCMSLAGSALMTGSWDATVKLWDASPTGVRNEPLCSYFDHETEVHSLDVYGNLVVSGASDGTIIVNDTRTEDPIRVLKARPSGTVPSLQHLCQHKSNCTTSTNARRVKHLKWLKCGSQFLACSTDNQLQLFDMASLNVPVSISNHSLPDSKHWQPNNIVLLDDDKEVLVGDHHGFVNRFNCVTGQFVRTFGTHGEAATVCVSSLMKSGDCIASGGVDGTLKLYKRFVRGQ